jgi:hypothetical protein
MKGVVLIPGSQFNKMATPNPRDKKVQYPSPSEKQGIPVPGLNCLQFPVIINAHSQFPEKINLVSQFPVKSIDFIS